MDTKNNKTTINKTSNQIKVSNNDNIAEYVKDYIIIFIFYYKNL